MQQSWEEIKQGLIDGESNSDAGSIASEEPESVLEPSSEVEIEVIDPVDRKQFYLQLIGFAAISTFVFSVTIYFLAPANAAPGAESSFENGQPAATGTDSLGNDPANDENELKVPEEDLIQF